MSTRWRDRAEFEEGNGIVGWVRERKEEKGERKSSRTV